MDKYAPYKVIEYGGEGEIVEKKSRFIAHVQATHTEEEAVAFIEAEKKRYWDARHHCYAYIIGEQGETVRYSDDGEPSGTAGRPILEVLTGSGIRGLTLVVTRYFGGTLLGTGGLVRAYSGAVKEALKSAERGMMRFGVKLRIGTDYNGVGKLQHLFGKSGTAFEAEYGEAVRFVLTVPAGEADVLKKEITETTNGKAVIEELEKIYFIDKE